jgi:hypothetical protein
MEDELSNAIRNTIKGEIFMKNIFRVNIYVILILSILISYTFGSDLNDELKSLEESLKEYEKILENSQIVLLDEEYQLALSLPMITRRQTLTSALIKYRLSHPGIDFAQKYSEILRFSRQAKEIIRNDTIPRIEEKIVSLRHALNREQFPTGFSDSPYDCGGILTMEYLENLRDQHINELRNKWERLGGTMPGYITATASLQGMPKYEANLEVLLRRYKCLDNCASCRPENETEWLKCSNECKKIEYKVCKPY